VGFLEDIAGGIVGGDIDEVRDQGIGQQLSGAPGRGADMAAMFSPLGEGMDLQASITGEFAGESVPMWQRVLGIGGPMLGGVMATGNLLTRQNRLLQNAYHVSQSRHMNALAKRPGSIGSLAGKIADYTSDQKVRRALTTLSDGPVNEKSNRLAVLNRSRVDPEVQFGTQSSHVNRMLQVVDDNDADHYGQMMRGWRDVGSTRGKTRKNLDTLEGEIDGEWVDHMSIWGMGLAARLVDEVDEHKMGTAMYNRSEDAGHRALAYELGRMYSSIKEDRLTGKGADELAGLFKKARSGETLPSDDMVKLSDGIVAHAKLTQAFVHPELRLAPLVRVGKIDLDKETMELDVLRMPKMSHKSMSQSELQKRMVAAVRHDPSWWAEASSMNVEEFFDTHVTMDTIRWWRNWYPKARQQLLEDSAKTGIHPHKSVAIASILSAGEDWRTNVAKGSETVKEMQRVSEMTKDANRMMEDVLAASGIYAKSKVADRGGRIKYVHEQIKGKGWKLSEDDLVRVMLVEALNPDEVSDFWTRGAGDKGLTLKEIGQRWEAGESMRDLIDSRKTSDEWSGLKQPSFEDAIYRSVDDEILERHLTMAEMMVGDTGYSKVPGDELRRRLPVVSDRQAFKVGFGGSMNPDQVLDTIGAYDGLSQGFRVAAARISARLADELPGGQALTPEELQAVTWMEYRRLAQVTAENFTDNFHADGRHRPGWLRPHGNKAGFGQKGMDLVMNRRIIDTLYGNDDPAGLVPYQAVASNWRNLRKTLKKGDFGKTTLKKGKGYQAHQVKISMLPDGGYDVAGYGSPPRGTYAMPTFEGDGGAQQYGPTAPVELGMPSVRYVEEHLNQRSWDITDPEGAFAGQGGSVTPNTTPQQILDGNLAVQVGIPLKRQATGKVQDEMQIIQRIRNDLEKKYDVQVEIMDPHKGVSTKLVDDKGKDHWTVPQGSKIDDFEIKPDNEMRRYLYVYPKNADDLEKISEYFMTPAVGGGKANETFARMRGVDAPEVNPAENFRADPIIGEKIAVEYSRLPKFVTNESVRLSYDSFIRDTVDQLREMVQGNGVRVTFTDDDPYGNMQALFRDLDENNHMYVFKTEEGMNPLMADELDVSLFGDNLVNEGSTGVMHNDMFRAVHDYFGHYAAKNDFNRHGEELAWALHAELYSDDAMSAMTSEARGQNAYLNFSPDNRIPRDASPYDLTATGSGSGPKPEAQRVAEIGSDAPGMMRVRVPLEDADSILTDGFKPDIAKSRGVSDPARRAVGEEALGVPATADRPVFGYLGDAYSHNDTAGYGEIVLHVKPKVAGRATVTFGDSLQAAESPGGVRPVGVDALAGADDAALSAASAPRPGAADSTAKRYYEVQYHGGLQPEDLAKVVEYSAETADDWIQPPVAYHKLDQAADLARKHDAKLLVQAPLDGNTDAMDSWVARARQEGLNVEVVDSSKGSKRSSQGLGKFIDQRVAPTPVEWETMGRYDTLQFSKPASTRLADLTGDEVPEILVWGDPESGAPRGFKKAQQLIYWDGEEQFSTLTGNIDETRPNGLTVYVGSDFGQESLSKYFANVESPLTTPGVKGYVFEPDGGGGGMLAGMAEIQFAKTVDEDIIGHVHKEPQHGLTGLHFSSKQNVDIDEGRVNQMIITHREEGVPLVEVGHKKRAPLPMETDEGTDKIWLQRSGAGAWTVKKYKGRGQPVWLIEKARTVLDHIGSEFTMKVARK